MKKFFKSFIVIILCFCACLTFVGCDKGKMSETTNATDKVISNGGITVYADGWLYFINGSKTNNEANNKAKNVMGGIYRVKTNLEGEILYNEPLSENEEENEDRTFTKVERLVSNLAGFDEGSLFIFGDYLYFTTPCTRRNNKGTMLVGRTEFRRYDIVNKKQQLLYTTEQSDDTIDYTYYKQGNTLNLIVYEKNAKTVKSLLIGSKVKTNFEKKDVTSCVLSQNFGEAYKNGQTDKYVYFTLAADPDSQYKSGSRVYRILPDGTEEKKISEGQTLNLLTIKGDHLIYSSEASSSTLIYAQKVTAQTEKLSFESDAVISYESYENTIFVEENGKINSLVFDGAWLRRIEYVDGALNNDASNYIYRFDDDDKIALIGIYGDYVIYQLTSSATSSLSNRVYKLKYKNVDVENNEEKYPIMLSTTSINAADGRLAPEIVDVMDGYLYAFSSVSSSSETYMYQISIKTPKEKGETNEDETPKQVGEAVLVGVKQ